MFLSPKINQDAKACYKLVKLNGLDLVQPPAIRSFTDAEIDKIRITPLILNWRCHN